MIESHGWNDAPSRISVGSDCGGKRPPSGPPAWITLSWPPWIPPQTRRQSSRRIANGVSMKPTYGMSPENDHIFVPLWRALPISRYHSELCRMISGTLA